MRMSGLAALGLAVCAALAAGVAPQAQAVAPVPITVTPSFVVRGGAVSVAGGLWCDPINPIYRLVVVPAGQYVPGTCYLGTPLATLDIDTTSGCARTATGGDAVAIPVPGFTFGPVVIWPSAGPAGQYDVLVLHGTCTALAASAMGAQPAAAAPQELIIGGTDLGPGIGLDVVDPVPATSSLGLGIFMAMLLAAGAFVLVRVRR